QVVLMDDNLRLLPRAIDRARDAMGLVRQNLAIISVPNLFGIMFALLVPMSPAVAGILSNGSTIVAAANGLRPLNRRQPEIGTFRYALLSIGLPVPGNRYER